MENRSGKIMQIEIWKLQIGKELPARVADLQPLRFIGDEDVSPI